MSPLRSFQPCLTEHQVTVNRGSTEEGDVWPCGSGQCRVLPCQELAQPALACTLLLLLWYVQDLKQEIKHTLQNKLHRNAGPEDLVAAEAMLQRILGGYAVCRQSCNQPSHTSHGIDVLCWGVSTHPIRSTSD